MKKFFYTVLYQKILLLKRRPIEADIVMRNDKTRVWIVMNNNHLKKFSNINIEFLDNVGNVVGKI